MRTNKSRKFDTARVAPGAQGKATLPLVYFVAALLFTSRAPMVAGKETFLQGVNGSPFAPISEKVTPDCRRDSVAYLTSLRNPAGWSLDMLSSSTNIQEGLQSATIAKIGDFDRCTQVTAPRSCHGFRGQYCTASVTLSAIQGINITAATFGPDKLSFARAMVRATAGGIPYIWAFCVPSSCSETDVASSLDDALRGTLAPVGVNATVVVNRGQCMMSSEDSSSLSGADIAMVVVLSFFGLLVFASTVYEIFIPTWFGGNSRIILSSFSLLTNGKKILIGNSGESVMGCLHGLRFLSICWIIFGHTFYTSSVLPVINTEDVLQLTRDWTKMIVLNESVAVDTFFLLSGLLLIHVFLREREQGSKFNFFAFYLHRYIRLTPPYAILIGFYATLFYRVGSGPLWDTHVGKNRIYCERNWWTNLLYVNNYVNINEPCMDQTWYLAVDMQLYWFSPFLLLSVWQWPKAAKYIIGIVGVASVLPPLAVTAAERLPAAMFFNDNPQNVSNVFTDVYTRAYARAGPYMVGIGLGYLLYICRGKRIVIPKAVVALCWTASTAICLATVFGIYGMMQKDYEYNVVVSSLYAGLHRTVWAIGLAWVVFACCTGYGGPVNAILSWNALAPFSRLTYCAYLSHYMVILYNAGTTRTVGYFSPYTVARDFLGNLAIAVAISFVVSVAFESPFMTLSKVLLRGGGNRCVVTNNSTTQPTFQKFFRPTEAIPSPSSSGENLEDPQSNATDVSETALEAVVNVDGAEKIDQKSANFDQKSANGHSYENNGFEQIM